MGWACARPLAQRSRAPSHADERAAVAAPHRRLRACALRADRARRRRHLVERPGRRDRRRARALADHGADDPPAPGGRGAVGDRLQAPVDALARVACAVVGDRAARGDRPRGRVARARPGRAVAARQLGRVRLPALAALLPARDDALRAVGVPASLAVGAVRRRADRDPLAVPLAVPDPAVALPRREPDLGDRDRVHPAARGAAALALRDGAPRRGALDPVVPARAGRAVADLRRLAGGGGAAPADRAPGRGCDRARPLPSREPRHTCRPARGDRRLLAGAAPRRARAVARGERQRVPRRGDRAGYRHALRPGARRQDARELPRRHLPRQRGARLARGGSGPAPAGRRPAAGRRRSARDLPVRRRRRPTLRPRCAASGDEQGHRVLALLPVRSLDGAHRARDDRAAAPGRLGVRRGRCRCETQPDLRGLLGALSRHLAPLEQGAGGGGPRQRGHRRPRRRRDASALGRGSGLARQLPDDRCARARLGGLYPRCVVGDETGARRDQLRRQRPGADERHGSDRDPRGARARGVLQGDQQADVVGWQRDDAARRHARGPGSRAPGRRRR